nr:ABC transporter ATP-binding protein [Actinomadura rugatobispora]
MAATVLEADELYRFYRAAEGEETIALRGVSLTLEAGGFIAVTGPSGSGKSTLMSCLAGLDEPDGGTVRLDGTPISHRPERERARLRARLVGVVTQTGNLIDHLTVRRNIDLAQRIGARPDRAWREELLRELGLTARGGAEPAALSGGEAARAALAVALATRPPVVLADEPTGELDAHTESEVLALLSGLAESGVGVVVASHSPAVALAADRTVHLRDGRIMTSGEPRR